MAKKQGCLTTLLSGVVAVILLVWGINSCMNLTPEQRPAGQSPATAPAASQPAAAADKSGYNLFHPVPAEEDRLKTQPEPSKNGTGGATQPPTAVPPASQSAQVQSADEAAEALDAAIRACLKPLKATPAYKEAAAKNLEAAAKVASLREYTTPEDRLAAANAHLKTAKDVGKLEADALAGDEAVGKARRAFASAREREEREAAALAAKIKDAKERQRIEEERIANSPVNKAIRRHELVRGMTCDEAVKALGSPYSVTNAGNIVVATWEFGDGNYWSATFSDGIATVVSHTRL